MLCKSYINLTEKSAGAAADTRETQKSSKYTSLSENYLFALIGIETWGRGLKLIRSIGKRSGM